MRWAAAAVTLAIVPTPARADSSHQPVSTAPAAAVPPAEPNDQAHPKPASFWHVVKRFDFDEARLGNETDLPMYWYPLRGQDFPRFARGLWDRTTGYHSNESFLLELNGGNVGYFYRPNQIAIAPGQDIRVEAMVRTTGLVHARALLEVYFTDARRGAVPGSERRSELIGGPDHNDRWIQVSAFIPGRYESARYVNIRLYILQPHRRQSLESGDKPAVGAPGPHASGLVGPEPINYVDVHGKAWFDDITIYRLPRVTLTSGQPCQLLPHGAPNHLNIAIAGFPNQPLEAELLVRDMTDRLIGHKVYQSHNQDEQTSRQFAWPTGALPAGLYQAQLRLFAAGARSAGLAPLLTRQLVFAQLPPDGRGPSGRLQGAIRPDLGTTALATAEPGHARVKPGWGRGFGLVIPAQGSAPSLALEPEAAVRLADEQADALACLPAAIIKLPLWRGQGRLDALQQTDAWTDQVVRRLVGQRLAMVGAFGQIPAPLQELPAAGKGADRNLSLRRTLLDVLSEDPTTWRPYLAFQLARYAEQIQYWQIGREDELSFALDRRFAPAVARARQEFRALLTEPVFVATWPALYSYRQAAGTENAPTPSLQVGAGFPAEQANVFLSNRITADSVGDYLADFIEATGRRPWATVQALNENDYQRVPRLADLAWRLVSAGSLLADPLPPARTVGRSTGAGTVFLAAPWTLREVGGQEFLEPTEELLIFRAAADLLSNVRFGGQLALTDGVVGLIFDRGNGDGVLAVHNTGADPNLPIELYLGDQVERVDLWGNRRPVRTLPDGKQQFAAGRVPFYLDHIDPRLARLRASFALEPNLVPSSYKRHVRNVRFVNGFPMPISGRLTLHFPKDWDVQPKVIPFTVQPNETFAREVEIRFPYNVEAGVKQLVGDLAIDADQNYRIQATTRFEFGLGDVAVRTLTQWLPDAELLVSVTVTNGTDNPLDAFCFVSPPDRPRQERVIAGLFPGGSAVKSFRIPRARELAGQSIRVGLREVTGARVVNYAVPIR